MKGTTVILQISREISLPFSWNFLRGRGGAKSLDKADLAVQTQGSWVSGKLLQFFPVTL